MKKPANGEVSRENVVKPRTTTQETNADWMCKLPLCLEFF